MTVHTLLTLEIPMKNQTIPQTPSERPQGDTGQGTTGVPDDKQGISNRPGDRDEETRRKTEEAQERRPSPTAGA
jgi:hypothetical protein